MRLRSDVVNLTTRSYVYIMDDNDLPFETLDDINPRSYTCKDEWLSAIPIEDRYPAEFDNPWESHDWTSDYDEPNEYSPDHDEEFE